MPASVRESLTGNLRRKAQFTSVTGNSKLEAAYHRADKAIQQIVDLLAA
jgi:hypothetical protein